jgi:exodeoxyribonuclease VII small subunit
MAKKKTASKSDRNGNSETLDFEQSLSEVEQIVARLEGGQLGLTESLQQYEQGIRQLKICHELLDAAEQRVNVLAGFDAEGNPVLEPLQGASKSRKAGLARQSSGTDLADDEEDRPGLF